MLVCHAGFEMQDPARGGEDEERSPRALCGSLGLLQESSEPAAHGCSKLSAGAGAAGRDGWGAGMVDDCGFSTQHIRCYSQG